MHTQIFPRLAIVIHTEEEFNWDGGFFRDNNQVTHGQKLIVFCDKLIAVGAKITFAIDYAFVNSDDGKKVIQHYQSMPDDVEFATHLHPWVNPPFEDAAQICNNNSYPGNLSYDNEFEKLKNLTNKITEVTKIKPTTYLAGRYGIGDNTLAILYKLGYKTDISISPFSDFTHQEGPNFSHLNNTVFVKNKIIHWPHTTAIVSIFSWVEKWFNANPANFETGQKNPLLRLLMKLSRVKRQRLSPEGFPLSDLKNITKTQLMLGQKDFIFSFHSPSVQAGLTPYVKTKEQEDAFLQTSLAYIRWFLDEQQGHSTLVNKQDIGA